MTGKKVRNAVTIVLVLGLMLLLIPGTAANAEGGTSLSIQAPADIPESSVFQVKVQVDQVAHLAGYQFQLTYDPAVISLTGVAAGKIASTIVPVDGFSYLSLNPPDTQRTVRIYGHFPQIIGESSASGAGTLCGVSFLVTGVEGESSPLILSNISLYDPQGVPLLPVSGGEGQIQVIAATTLPVVASVAPDSAAQGTNVDGVVITGINFTGTAQDGVSFGDGVEVSRIEVESDTLITADISIASSAMVGERDIAVTNPAGSGILSGGFEVTRGQGVTLSVVAPDVVSRDSDFTINVETSYVNGLAGFDLSFSFDPSVFDITGITTGMVGSASIPLNGQEVVVDTAGVRTLRVYGQLPQASEVNHTDGAGAIVLFNCHVLGAAGQTSSLELSDAGLTDNLSTEIQVSNLVDASLEVDNQTVLPQIIGLEPSQVQQGMSRNIVISGAGFTGVDNASFSGTGVTVNSITVNSDSEIIANISVAVDAAPDFRDVVVSSPSGNSSPFSGGFEVVLRGDTNNDGILTIADVILAELMMLNRIPITCGADANADGLLNIADVLVMELIMIGAL